MDKAYSYEELGALKSQILDICEQVRRDNPTAWREAHNGNFDDTSTRYNDLCVQALRAAGIFAGCNGKRGGDQRSDDVLAFGLSDGRGAQDRSGRFRSMAIIDYIAGAGGPDPSVGWNDVSHAAPGRFLDPQGLARVDGPSAPSNPGTQPGPHPGQPTPPSAPQVDLTAVLDVLAQTNARIDGMTDQIVAKVSGELHALIGETLIAVHVNDILGRLDAVKADAVAVRTVVERARVLRY